MSCRGQSPQADLSAEIFMWSERRGSNPQPSAWEADAIPLGHSRNKGQDYFNLNLKSCQTN